MLPPEKRSASLRMAGGSAARLDAVVRVVRRMWTRTPQTEMLRARVLRKRFKAVRVPTSAEFVEVRGCSAERDKAQVHVAVVTGADDVAQQPPVLVDVVGGGLGDEDDACARREKTRRDRGCLSAVALGSGVHLGRVDLDEADLLAIAEPDRVSIDHMVDPVGRAPLWGRARGGREERRDDEA
jgi:hypothetical protein